MASSEGRVLTIGILQLEYHAASTVGSCDFLEEPLGTVLVSPLRTKLSVDPALKAIRARYLDWCSVRLQEVLDALACSGNLPDVLVLPECSVPRECLHILHSFAITNAVTVLAGTHTPSASAGEATYKPVGVRLNHARAVLTKRPSQILPVFHATKAQLIGKKNRSIHELTEVAADASGSTSAPSVIPILVGSSTINISVAICADALRQATTPIDADLEVIVALQKDPTAFSARAEHLCSNGIPVVLANHAAFGGSGIFANVDTRTTPWFFGPPFMGRLPQGECYVEFRLRLDSSAVQVSTTNPLRPAELVRLVPILHASRPLHKLNEAAEKACFSRNTSELEACVRELDKLGAPLLAERWRHMLALLQVDNADHVARFAFGSTLTVRAAPIQDLQDELCEEIAGQLEATLQLSSSQDLPLETIGAAAKVVMKLRARLGRKTVAPSAPSGATARSVIDRTRETDRIRDFINQRGGVLLVSGLPQIGKSAIIEKALQDTGAKSAVLQCREGTSADFLFEVLLRHGNCTPTTARPRLEFDAAEIETALRAIDVLWVRDAQHLVMTRSWAAPAVESFVSALIDAASRTRVSILVETTTGLPHPWSSTGNVSRVHVKGLTEKDGAAVFMRELRALGGVSDSTTIDEMAQLSKLVSGHPRLLVMCAEACVREPIHALVEQLEKGIGEISASAERLLGELKLTERDKSALRCLAETRAPIPAPLLVVIARESDAVGVLEGSSLVERDDADYVQLAPLLRFIAKRFEIDNVTRLAFHRAASSHFAKASRDAAPSKALEWAVEANYHAQQGGVPQPCPVDGLLDPIVALARQAMDEGDFTGALTVLEPLTRGRVSAWEIARTRPDVVKMLVVSFAKTARFREANECVEALLTQGIGHAVMYLDVAAGALHAGQLDVAKRCTELARRHVPTTPALPVMEGRICERENDFQGAFDRFKLACTLPGRHPWAPFYLARLLLTVDEPNEALTVVEAGLSDVVDGLGRIARGRENALRELQLQALLLAGRLQEAETLAKALLSTEDLAPEAMLTLAYVGAQSKDNAYDVLGHFDDVVRKASTRARSERGFFARVALFRGKLLERAGDVVGAEAEFARATKGQPFHRHVLVCHHRTLSALLEKRPHDISARSRRAEVEQSLKSLAIAGKEALAPLTPERL